MCFLWVLLDDQRLTAEARAMIEGASEVYVSAASVWEIAIKSALGKIEADPFAIVSAIAQWLHRATDLCCARRPGCNASCCGRSQGSVRSTIGRPIDDSAAHLGEGG